MNIRPYTDKEWGELPTIILTSGDNWDPKVLDYTLTDKTTWFDKINGASLSPHGTIFKDVLTNVPRCKTPGDVNMCVMCDTPLTSTKVLMDTDDMVTSNSNMVITYEKCMPMKAIINKASSMMHFSPPHPPDFAAGMKLKAAIKADTKVLRNKVKIDVILMANTSKAYNHTNNADITIYTAVKNWDNKGENAAVMTNAQPTIPCPPPMPPDLALALIATLVQEKPNISDATPVNVMTNIADDVTSSATKHTADIDNMMAHNNVTIMNDVIVKN